MQHQDDRGDTDRALEPLGDVFTTEEYRHAAGVKTRGVPDGLRSAERENLVVNVKPGLWLKTWPLDGTKRYTNYVVATRAMYGDRPHRFSHRTPIRGVPAKAREAIFVNTPFPVGNKELAGRLRIEEIYEPEDTFWEFSEHLGETTWTSTKQRALMECAMFPHRVFDLANLLIHGMQMYANPSDLIRIAERLQWETALQRLQSLATEFRNHYEYETLRLTLDEGFCNMLPDHPRKWAHLYGTKWAYKGHRIEYADYVNKVWWHMLPDVMVEDFLW